MRTSVEELLESWQWMWRAVGSCSDGRPVFDALIASYSQPHRRYHTLQHLLECVRTFETASTVCAEPAEVEAALWFHDAIFDIPAHDNEERSAAWVHRALTEAGVPSERAARVQQMVLATTHVAMPPAGDACVVVDVDLAILGAAEPRFLESQEQLRDEYAAVPEETYRARRKDILRSFLSRPSIYSTARFRDTLEIAARRNLTKALAKLG